MKTLYSTSENNWIEIDSKPISQEETDKANLIYTVHSNKVKISESYEFISCTIIFKEKLITGIINCRINGEHKQIRF